jgi:hypothetical protein
MFLNLILLLQIILQLIVYYEVPAENQKREEVKRKFENFVQSQIHLQQREIILNHHLNNFFIQSKIYY